MNRKYLSGSLSGLLLTGKLMAATFVNTPTVSGTWSIENSPYYIQNNITITEGSSLHIQPGVEVIFMGNYSITVNGDLSAVGTPEQKILFKASDTTGWQNRSIPDGGWSGVSIMNNNSATLSQPTLAYCIFKDVKNLQGAVIGAYGPNMFIDHCDFYHNYVAGNLLNMQRFGNNAANSRLKFTNNNLYDNYALGSIMHTLHTDTSIVNYNKFYNNESIYGIYTRTTLQDTSSSVLIFDQNEMYNNTVKENTAILNVLSGGNAFISRNKVHHNKTTLKAAVYVGSKTAVIEQNLIANNTREQKGGFFCGINDGGAGLLLLGQTVIQDIPGMNLYIVRNNVIANNHSDISGGGIWAQHCKATIVNNTIVNNTAAEKGAGIHGWGAYCKLKVHNNIIQGNKLTMQPNDTVYNNFNFYTNELNLSDNLIDHNYTNPLNGTAYPQNVRDLSIALAAPTTGAGTTYNALTADFSPTPSSLNIINKGNNNAPDYGTIDYAGNARINGNRIDMGAIEYKGNTGTGIKEQQLAGQIKLYPVPAQQTITLSNNTDKQIQNIQLFNVQGQQYEVKFEQIGSVLQINLGNRPAGNYYLQVLLADGQTAHKAFTID